MTNGTVGGGPADGGPSQTLSLRNERKPCHFWADNEVVDVYQPIIGADAAWVYIRIARNAHGAWIVTPGTSTKDPRVSLREMAEWCGKSVDTVWRCLQVLQHVGLIRAQQAVRSKGKYALADVKDLVLRQGGEYDRATGSLQLPVARAAALKAEVRELRARLSRKTRGLEVVGGKSAATKSVAQSDSLEGALFSLPDGKCDSFVAQSDTSVAPGATDIITTRKQENKTEIPPQPPPLRFGGDGEAAWPDCTIDQAVQRVMDALGATARRLHRKIRAQVAKHVDLGDKAGETADRMIAAYNKQAKNCDLLFRVAPAAEFFESGLWLDWNRWNWNRAALREQQEQMKASVGTYR